MEKVSVSRATLGRLPLYLQFLEQLPEEKYEYISATTIAKHLSLGEVQVRKDLASISGKGRPKLGYLTRELVSNLESYLGHHSLTNAVLVGAGRLGRALLEYGGFEKFGVKILAAFDCNEQVITHGGKIDILPIKDFYSFCKEHNIQIGIITVGVGSAQEVCDLMVKCGISAIWNFAPCKLSIPDGVLLQNENLALSLAHLSNQLSASARG